MSFRLVSKSMTLNDLNGVMAVTLRYFGRLQCDLVTCFKIIHGFYRAAWNAVAV